MIAIDMAATFIVAVLAGMGIGSGGLMVIYLTLIRGTEQLAAQGFNLMFFLFASCASMTVHLLRRHIYGLAVMIMILSGLPAAYLGTRLAILLPPMLGRGIFGFFLILVSLSSLTRAVKSKKTQK